MSKKDQYICSYCYKAIQNIEESTVYCSNQCRDNVSVLQINGLKDMIQFMIQALRKLGIKVLLDDDEEFRKPPK